MNYIVINSKEDKQYNICSYLVNRYKSKNDYYSNNKIIVKKNSIILKDDIEYIFTSKELRDSILRTWQNEDT